MSLTTMTPESSLREKQILLAALAKDVLTSMGEESVQIGDGNLAVVVSRFMLPTRMDGTPSELSADRARMIAERRATRHESDLLCEIEITDD